LGGAHSYFDASSETGDPVLRGTMPAGPYDYSTFAFAREACAFIERHADEPFFLYLPFNAVHNPMHALPDYLDRFRHIQDEMRRTYAAMLSAMDDAVGMVLDRLADDRLMQNSLIFFISDNGGPTAQTTSRNDPLRSVKGQVYEGGIRVPFFIRWDGRLPRGSVYELPVITLDVLPTSLAAASAPINPAWDLDGVDLLPYLEGKVSGRPHETLYWRFGEQRAVRRGDWKLVRAGQSVGWELYNLVEDISEQNDLAARRPDLVRDLSALWEAWNSELEPPRWGSPGRQRLQR
jgi:arylsulfatase A-like enzyme